MKLSKIFGSFIFLYYLCIRNKNIKAMKKYFEKGTYICVYNVEDKYGNKLPDVEINVGEEILKSDDDYDMKKGKLVVTISDIEDAIYDYMRYNYPEVYDYMFNIEDD